MAEFAVGNISGKYQDEISVTKYQDIQNNILGNIRKYQDIQNNILGNIRKYQEISGHPK
jgi:hypothetical protein